MTKVWNLALCALALAIPLIGMGCSDHTNRAPHDLMTEIHKCQQTSHMTCTVERDPDGTIEIIGTYCPTEDSCDYNYQNGHGGVKPIIP